jgi:hypothetical protein
VLGSSVGGVTVVSSGLVEQNAALHYKIASINMSHNGYTNAPPHLCQSFIFNFLCEGHKGECLPSL